MAKGRYWQERSTRVGELAVLVVRARWRRGEEDRWECEAWMLAPRGMGDFFLDGRWYVRPFRDTAKRAIWYAFPGITGEWVDERLIEPVDAPDVRGRPKTE